IILFSGQVTSNDMGMLNDLGVSGLIRKPSVKDHVSGQLIQLLSDENSVANVKAQKRRFYQALRANDIKTAKEVMQELRVNHKNQRHVTLLLEAEFDFRDGKIEAAKKKAMN